MIWNGKNIEKYKSIDYCLFIGEWMSYYNYEMFKCTYLKNNSHRPTIY